MKKIGFAVLCLAAVLAEGGCTAGLAADLLADDVMTSAAQEAMKGVVAYDTAMRAEAVRLRGALLDQLKVDIIDIAQPPKPLDRAGAEKAAAAEVQVLSQKLDEMAEQEARRQGLFATTTDNLSFIQETAASARKFSIYRSSIEQQWKDYLQATAEAALAKNKAATASATATTVLVPTTKPVK